MSVGMFSTGAAMCVGAYKPAAGGGPTNTPSVVGAGTGGVALGNPAPAWPAGIASGDYAQLQLWQIAATPTPPTTPSGWTLLYSNVQGTVGQWIYEATSRLAGTESGTFTVTWDGNLNFGRVYAYRNVALAAYIEGASSSSGAASATLNAPSVVTGGNARRAIAYVAKTGNTGMASFTGETGGDWLEAVAEFGNAFGTGGEGQLQTADMSSGGTISGGSDTYSGTPNSVCRAFALIGT